MLYMKENNEGTLYSFLNNTDPKKKYIDPTLVTRTDYVEEDLDYLPLYTATLQGNWLEAKKVLDHHSGPGINVMKRNALHAAASTGKAKHIVEALIKEMPDECIAPDGGSGDTALTVAATVGNMQVAISLVTKLPWLLYITDSRGDFPVQVAALHAQRKMLDYLISVTKCDNDFGVNPYKTGGISLLVYVIDAEFFDIALNLVEKDPELPRIAHLCVDSPLENIASKKSFFCSESSFNFWERFISSRVTKSIKEKTLLKLQALELVKYLCKGIHESMGYEDARDIYFNACLIAAELGIHEVLEVIIQAFPSAMYSPTAESNQFLFHVAVKNRSDHIYNLICQRGDPYRIQLISAKQDSEGNNPLHLAGKRAPSHKLDEISGAALQMQHEMQWYKELERFVSPRSREQKNKEGKTPKMVFTEEHKQLKEGGEKWMKDTANSCTIAAALIATVMFAAAITVPGGHDSSNGLPIFSNNAAFIVFAISDAVSLFTSATSLLMFLAILTSRYAEEDFLYVLPKRLIIGLGTLFLSITFMMMAFSATIYLVFGRQKAWVLIPVGGLACLPVASFVLLQFPLLYDLISSTYGSRFDKQRTL